MTNRFEGSVPKIRTRFLPDPCPILGEFLFGRRNSIRQKLKAVLPGHTDTRPADCRRNQPWRLDLGNCEVISEALENRFAQQPIVRQRAISTSASTSGSTQVALDFFTGMLRGDFFRVSGSNLSRSSRALDSV